MQNRCKHNIHVVNNASYTHAAKYLYLCVNKPRVCAGDADDLDTQAAAPSYASVSHLQGCSSCFSDLSPNIYTVRSRPFYFDEVDSVCLHRCRQTTACYV